MADVAAVVATAIATAVAVTADARDNGEWLMVIGYRLLVIEYW